MQKITPFLWFNNNAEEAVAFYTSIFKNSKAGSMVRNPSENAGQPGSVLSTSFNLEGQEFIALNGGPHFKFNEAVSFVVNCASQEEIDYYWQKLTDGGSPSRCGWLKDRFGLSWQIVPSILPQLLQHKDPQKAKAAMEALMKMDKIVISDLQ